MVTNPFAIVQHTTNSEDNNSVKALIVGESRMDQIILSRLLINNNFDVCIAPNGDAAIHKFNEYKPDIVFMHLNLPDISGYDLTRILKRLSTDKYIPIVFVTGASDDEFLGRCFDSGGDDFFVKPIREGLLNAKINSLLRIKKIHDDMYDEKKVLASHSDEQLKDLYDAKSIIYNIHKPRFHNSGNIEWSYVAQNILSGDIVCSAETPSGNHVVLIGDNTGHGLPAAIGSIITCETFYSMVNKGFDIQVIIEAINKKIFFLLPTDRFLAATIIEFNFDYKSMKLWIAGMPNVLVINSNGALKTTLNSMHMPLGIILFDKKDVVPISVNLEENDRIYAYTDGLIEVFNARGEMFGEEGLLKAIRSSCTLEQRVDAIVNQTKKFSNNASVTDDVLLLEINCDKKLIKKRGKNKIHTNEIKPMDWHVKFDLKTDVISKTNPIPGLIQAIVEMQGFGGHREKIFLILTEMYSNAVEHGILNLDSSIKEEENGFVKYYDLRQTKLNSLTDGNILIEINHYVENEKGIVSFTMKDNGIGFDHTQVMAELSKNTMKSGRGIALLYDLCRKCEYSDGGRTLNVEYEWQLERVANVA